MRIKEKEKKKAQKSFLKKFWSLSKNIDFLTYIREKGKTKNEAEKRSRKIIHAKAYLK